VFRIQWRGRSLTVKIDQAEQLLRATLHTGEPMVLFVGGQPNHLRSARDLLVSTEKFKGTTRKSSP